MPRTTDRASVIGAGPNGLAAAITLASAGMQVDVYEAEDVPGGGARTLELTLPGFHHDFGSAVYPMAVSSPYFSRLPLEKYGLQWIFSPGELAHPFDDGTAVTLERDLRAQQGVLGPDGEPWRRLFEPLVREWPALMRDLLQPVAHVPRSPWLLARFGLRALLPAKLLAESVFTGHRARALFAGSAAHSFLALNEPISSAFGLILSAAGHAVGWPVPRGGAQAITAALVAHLTSRGGVVHTSHRVANIDELPGTDLTMCDVTPRQLLAIAGHRFSTGVSQRAAPFPLRSCHYKIDYALSDPIPWTARECARAITVHVGGTLEEIAASEWAMRHGGIRRGPSSWWPSQRCLIPAGRRKVGTSPGSIAMRRPALIWI